MTNIHIYIYVNIANISGLYIKLTFHTYTYLHMVLGKWGNLGRLLVFVQYLC